MTTPTTRHTPIRTCDQLGVCQHLAQPCNGCTPAPRRSHRICSADQCQQGRAPCPCPTACELPEPLGALGHHLADAPPTRAELAGIALVLLVCVAGVAVLVKTALSA